MSMRIVFMGTPEFAVPSLRSLLDAGYEVAAVCCQPDRPKGRKSKLQACPVKELAVSRGIDVLQFEKLRSPEGVEALKAIAPDLFVTAAYGQILSQKLLDIPPLGTINVHASLLPKYRGSAPINWCIMNGEQKTGVTTMMTERGIDTGDMLMQRELDILPAETAQELTGRLSTLGAELLLETLTAIKAGNCPRIPQNEAESTYLPMLDKAHGRIDWTRDAQLVECLIRGVNPWPGAFTTMDGQVLKIWASHVSACDASGQAGEVIVSGAKQGLMVACGTGILEIDEIQSAGSKRMNAKDYLLGHPIEVGMILGKADE